MLLAVPWGCVRLQLRQDLPESFQRFSAEVVEATLKLGDLLEDDLLHSHEMTHQRIRLPFLLTQRGLAGLCALGILIVVVRPAILVRKAAHDELRLSEAWSDSPAEYFDECLELLLLDGYQILNSLPLLPAELGDLPQVVVLLLYVEKVDRVHLLRRELECDRRAICQMEPAGRVSQGAVLAARLASLGEPGVVEVLLDEAGQGILEERVGEKLPVLARVATDVALRGHVYLVPIPHPLLSQCSSHLGLGL